MREVVDVAERIAVFLVEAVATDIAPIRQQRGLLYAIGPAHADVCRVVVEWAVGKGECVRVAAFQGLNVCDLVSTEDGIEPSAPVHKMSALPYRQLIRGESDKPMRTIEAGARFFESTILDWRNAGLRRIA